MRMTFYRGVFSESIFTHRRAGGVEPTRRPLDHGRKYPWSGTNNGGCGRGRLIIAILQEEPRAQSTANDHTFRSAPVGAPRGSRPRSTRRAECSFFLANFSSFLTVRFTPFFVVFRAKTQRERHFRDRRACHITSLIFRTQLRLAPIQLHTRSPPIIRRPHTPVFTSPIFGPAPCR